MLETIDPGRRRILAGAVTAIAAAGLSVSGPAHAQIGKLLSTPIRLPGEGRLPSLAGATGWLNSPPLTEASLHGKVVLIDVWTYTCINWIRTLPYVRAWYDKYREKGFVVVGVHSPEFEFEKNVDNIRRAARDFKVTYPVAIDSNFSIWRALDNRYWPALYFVDAKGEIRGRHFGEGEYAQSEMMIKQLLAETGVRGIDDKLVSVEARGLEAQADWSNLRSPETYVGYGQARNFSSSGRAVLDRSHTFAAPAVLSLNNWALSGDWTLQKAFAALNARNGTIAYRFHARDLHLVMGPSTPGASVRFRVSIDGQPPRTSHGVDVDEAGNGRAAEQRLYQLVRQQPPVRDRRFEIEFLDLGVEAFAFTFG